VTVVPLTDEHWPEVERIYRVGIATGHATFESEPPAWEAFDGSRLPDQRLVDLETDGRVVGWAAATPVSDRCVYAGVVEHSVYVDRGRRHLDDPVGVFPENEASLAVHAAAGFRVVGTRERVGRMTYGALSGLWRDVVMVERRSTVVG
jgi:L-amino acid N-acyltransferase YncA